MTVNLLLLVICILLSLAASVLLGYSLYNHRRLREAAIKFWNASARSQELLETIQQLQAEVNKLRKTNEALALRNNSLQGQQSELLPAKQ